MKEVKKIFWSEVFGVTNITLVTYSAESKMVTLKNSTYYATKNKHYSHR